MSRVGKIARLPREVREQLNRRLDDGGSGVEAVAWLNALPEVKTVLEVDFAGRPVSEQNLSEWKLGGYIEWQKQQENLALVLELAANAGELTQIAGESLADMASPLLVARYVAILRTLCSGSVMTPDDRKVLHGLCGDLVALRKGDHSAARLKLEHERFSSGS